MAAFTAANLAGKTSNSMVRRWAECLSASVSAFVLCGVGCLMAVLNLQVLYTENAWFGHLALMMELNNCTLYVVVAIYGWTRIRVSC